MTHYIDHSHTMNHFCSKEQQNEILLLFLKFVRDSMHKVRVHSLNKAIYAQYKLNSTYLNESEVMQQVYALFLSEEL